LRRSLHRKKGSRVEPSRFAPRKTGDQKKPSGWRRVVALDPNSGFTLVSLGRSTTMNRVFSVAVALVAVALVTSVGLAVDVGEKAPQFKDLPTCDGKKVSLSDFDE